MDYSDTLEFFKLQKYEQWFCKLHRSTVCIFAATAKYSLVFDSDPCAAAVVVEPVGRSRRSAGDQSGPSGQPLDPAQPPASRDPFTL